jgi:hypothetical protein
MASITYTPAPIIVYSGATSTSTSTAILVQDYNTISVAVTGPSTSTIFTLPIQASNDDGLRSAIINWSTITSILSSGGTGSGVYSITPGMRWLRFGSPFSQCTVILAGNML